MSCPGRHHDWDESQTPSVCKKCGDPKKEPGRPKGSKNSRKLAGPAVAGRLAATLGVAAPAPRSASPVLESTPAPGAEGAPRPPSPALEAGAAPAPLPGGPTVAPDAEKAEPGRSAPPLKPKGWCKSAGKKLAKLFDVGVDWIGEEAFNRELNDADDDDLKEMGDGLGEQLAVWFPDSELTPWKKIIVAGACIVAEKSIGSTKLPPKPKAADAIATKAIAAPAGKSLTLVPATPVAPDAATTRAETNPPPSLT